MDYSYFSTAPQPYTQSFFNLPPTPAGSNTPHGMDDMPTNMSSDAYDAAFTAFQQSFHYDPSTFLAQPHNLSPQSPPKIMRHGSSASIPEYSPTGVSATGGDFSTEEPLLQRSSSEEKDSMTPAQSRRKAQNRAAQRAFRERKERHVKDLEAKLSDLERQSQSLNGENERLRRELARFATENEILRATSSQDGSLLDTDEAITGPMKYSPSDFSSDAKALHDSLGAQSTGPVKHDLSRHRTVISADTGEALLAAGATWDYIQKHELFRNGLVDVGDVCERLKKLARCDGQGPVFEEGDVRRAIAESAVAGGRDELI